MRGFLTGFAVGAVFGVLLILGPGAPTDSPWPSPTPTAMALRPNGIDWEEEQRKVALEQCRAEKIALEISCRLVWTGKPNPPRE